MSCIWHNCQSKPCLLILLPPVQSPTLCLASALECAPSCLHFAFPLPSPHSPLACKGLYYPPSQSSPWSCGAAWNGWCTNAQPNPSGVRVPFLQHIYDTHRLTQGTCTGITTVQDCTVSFCQTQFLSQLHLSNVSSALFDYVLFDYALFDYFFSVSQALRENTYPFLAMIMLKDRRMTVVGRLEGLIQPDDLINQLTFIMDANQTYLVSERLERYSPKNGDIISIFSLLYSVTFVFQLTWNQ